MSGRAPAARGGALALRLPRVTARYDPTQINTAFDLLERADAQSVKVQQQPGFPSIVLLSPTHIAYLLTVTDDGQLEVAQMPPTRPY